VKEIEVEEEEEEEEAEAEVTDSIGQAATILGKDISLTNFRQDLLLLNE
jgi:hypothetical protein